MIEGVCVVWCVHTHHCDFVSVFCVISAFCQKHITLREREREHNLVISFYL